MGKRILSVSYVDDAYQFLEVDRQAGGLFPQPSAVAATVESLLSACRKADEIHISAGMPTALYEWENFPKVAKRYLAQLVEQDAKEKIGVAVPAQVQFKPLGDVIDAGVAKTRIPYIAVQEEDLRPLWTTFHRFPKKVKFISPLPVALASTVANVDRPGANFMIVWVGESSSFIIISSADGLVKTARSVPIGLPKGPSGRDPNELRSLFEEIGREMFMTSTFFKQEFREPVPGMVYFLGNNSLEPMFQEQPIAGAPGEVRFGLSQSPVQGLSEAQINDYIHLIANLFLPAEYNFLSAEVVAGRKYSTAFSLAAAAMLLIMIGTGFWAFQLSLAKQNRQSEYLQQVAALKDAQQKLQLVREDVDRLRPFEGWKRFYEDTFQNRPAWNMIISELALLLPDNILIEGFKVTPMAQGAAGPALDAEMAGRIRAANWQVGLEDLRKFGVALQASPLFDVVDLNYAPENLESQAKVFEFRITLKLKPRGSAHES